MRTEPLHTQLPIAQASIRRRPSLDIEQVAFGQQQALHATRGMSVKILSTVETSSTTNPQRIEVMELEGYRRLTCSKQARLVDCRIGVVNKLDRRRRVVDNAIDLPWRH